MRCKLNIKNIEKNNYTGSKFGIWLKENKDKWLECSYEPTVMFQYRICEFVFSKYELMFEEDILKQKLKIICKE
jgi:hypothetical protein